MASNAQHIAELNALYGQGSLGCAAPPHACRTENAPAARIPRYACCGMTFDLTPALTHYFRTHFAAIDRDLDAKPRVCRTFRAIGDPAIPVVERADHFMKCLTAYPANPRHFRPAPLAQHPLRFRNPYSSAMALAYDYLETLATEPPEYAKFLAFLGAHPTRHRWPHWAHFRYPELLTHHRPAVLPTLHNIVAGFECPAEERPFACEEPGCPKRYKQVTGLQYHRAHAHPETNPLSNTPIQCPFPPCTKAYLSLTGLRNHLKKFHLQPHHFEADAAPPASPARPFVCPILPCKQVLASLPELREHTLKAHFWTFYSRHA